MPDDARRGLIECAPYTPSDADEMVQLLGEVFSRSDPPPVALGVTPSEFSSFVRLLCGEPSMKALTIVARHSGTGELAGVLLSQDCAAEWPVGIDQLGSKLDPIFAILGQLDEEYKADRAVLVGEAVHLLLLGVAESFGGQGIAKQLVETALDHARNRGFLLAVTEATGKVSQHIFRKHGFVDRVSRSYERFEFAGERPFASVGDQGGPILMDKSL